MYRQLSRSLIDSFYKDHKSSHYLAFHHIFYKSGIKSCINMCSIKFQAVIDTVVYFLYKCILHINRAGLDFFFPTFEFPRLTMTDLVNFSYIVLRFL
jgi:hypothetical protein